MFLFDNNKLLCPTINCPNHYHGKKLSSAIFKLFKKVFIRLIIIFPIYIYFDSYQDCYTYKICQDIYNNNMLYFSEKNYKFYIQEYKLIISNLILCRYDNNSIIYNFPYELIKLLLDHILSIIYPM